MARYKSGLRFKFTIWYNNGSHEETVITDIRDTLQWERNHGGKSFVAEEPGIDQLLWLAWANLKRNGRTDLQYQQWSDIVDDFDSDQAERPGTEGQDEGEPVPTTEAVGDGG